MAVGLFPDGLCRGHEGAGKPVQILQVLLEGSLQEGAGGVGGKGGRVVTRRMPVLPDNAIW